MNEIDLLFRESLINAALEDLTHPGKYQTLLNMAKPNWSDYLYKQETISLEKLFPSNLVERKYKVDIEEWYKNLLMGIYIETKKEYVKNFSSTRWGMKKIASTGFFKYGPLNHLGEIFFNFHICFRDGILFWDITTFRGKVNPKHFKKLPHIIANVIRKQGYDFLIRKNSKNFATMKTTGPLSEKIFLMLLRMKNKNIPIGNYANGRLRIKEQKKPVLEIVPIFEDNDVYLSILDKKSEEEVTRIILNGTIPNLI